jgi:predicted membrane-bound dolichyl-phosphate-mannose-protein mannosyltransferase
LFVIPVVILVLVWRHLMVADERSVSRAVVRLAAVGGIGALAGVIVLAPFRLGPVGAWDFYRQAARTYTVTSVFAFNLWGVVGFWRKDSGAEAFSVGGIAAVWIGLALFAAGGAFVLVRAWRALRDGHSEGRVLAFGGAAIVFVAFVTLTRIHDRYLFLAVGLLAGFLAFQKLRRAFLVVSALYVVNVYFPYVYYLRVEKRPAFAFAGGFDAFYGADIGGFKMKALSALTALVSLVIAWRGWRWLETSRTDDSLFLAPGVPTGGPPSVTGLEPQAVEVAEAKPPWRLQLHPIGRRGVLLALAVFFVALLSRIAGLGHPPGMYFDEVYHARTGAEYLNDKEVYEWTHPPLAKELIALSIKGLAGFDAGSPAAPGQGIDERSIAAGPRGNAWARSSAGLAEVFRGDLDADCRLQASGEATAVDVRPDVVALSANRVFVAGVSSTHGPTLVRLDGSRETLRVRLPTRARQLVALDDLAYLISDTDELTFVSADGKLDAVAAGAGSVVVAQRDGEVWASFPREGRIASWDRQGKRTAVIQMDGEPTSLAAPDGSDRVLVANGPRIEVVDSQAGRKDSTIAGDASLLAAVPETGLVWAVDGRDVRVIEPRGSSVIGGARLAAPASAIFADVGRHRLVAATDEGLVCVGGRPTFAWRLGSAVAGSLVVALVFLLALRLFGNIAGAGLASLFVAVEGLAFTISRIAMNDSYVTAFILVAWFCVLSALYRWGDPDRRRLPALLWLAAAGISTGLALASKWVGLYALVGIGLLFVWDGFTRKKESIWRVAGGFGTSAIVLALLFSVVPLGVYVLTYIPYFSLGHDFTDLVKLQRDMYGYHANLTASHPFGSPWYGWPFGYRAVFLYLADQAGTRSEMWTAPNIVVFWTGLAALVALARRALRARLIAPGVVILAAAVQFLPWTIVSRVTFMYHYLPVVPFLAIGIGWWLTDGMRGWRHQRRAQVIVPAAAIVFFLALLPIYEGWQMSTGYLEALRDALPWVLP